MSTRADFLAVLTLEQEVAALTTAALAEWLPVALDAVLPVFTAAASDPGPVPPDADAITRTAATVWDQILETRFMAGFAGLLDRLLGGVREKANAWRDRYLTGVRQRMAAVPGRALGRVRTAIRNAATITGAREAVARVLSPTEWAAAADELGRHEAVAVFNASRIELAAIESRETGAQFDKVWWCLHDDRTRPTHRAADRQRVPLSARFEVGTASLDRPGDPSGPPDEVMGCRCIVTIVPAQVQAPARVASASPPAGGTTMARTFEALLVPTGVVGRSGLFMLARDAQLLDTMLPMPLKWQPAAISGHEGSVTVGVIEQVEMREDGVYGLGFLLDNEHTDKVAQEIDNAVTRPSAELGLRAETITDAAGNPVTPETAEQMWMDGAQILSRWDAVEIMSAALVSVPEFRETWIRLGVGEPAGELSPQMALVAAAANARVVEPHRYPAEFFTDPELTEVAPIHVNSQGRVLGYLALWKTEHRAYPGLKKTPYHSNSGYADFHQSSAHLDDGTVKRVGRLTVGGGHGPVGRGARAALAHYDDVSTCWALVIAGENERGIWVSGAIHAQADEKMVQLALGTPHSGHWERVGGHPELIAAHAVNTPGFGIYEKVADREGDLAMVASFGPAPINHDVPTTVLDQVAFRAVAAYGEHLAARARAQEARTLVQAANRRRRILADVIREQHARRKAVI
ncbi:phage head morphogenesis protein [Nocardia farcinica]|uniref:phage head morphogenesis protein n=1 Tax=Nocardia farcinica TaxID=37329 RepID=UPI001E5C0126|nr:phage head morphogenesis protein [Nocardia farcinica]UEX21197.1 phage head morphogenesis protein [Nocardia farcinica]